MELEAKLRQVCGRIEPLDESAMAQASARLDSLTKPLGSLGRLEEIAIRIAGIKGEALPTAGKKAVVVMAGDHGVTAEGVSAYPAEVTPQMVMNFLGGGAAVNVLARQAGADVFCADLGVNADLAHPGLLAYKVRKGTANLCRGPAMTREEALRSVAAGIEIAAMLVEQGYELLAAGDMGIGNTTSSAALCAAFGAVPVEQAVGRGTGVDDERLRGKMEAVRAALDVNRPDPLDPIDVLSKVGGLEIGGLAGFM
ncbi:nicotinate-nucleotide--dimethylbenzimidazole phosphoribosyltransferase, partial [Paenibacillus darwinianus]